MTRTMHTRFYWPSVCDTCKRIPLIHVEFTQVFNKGCDWEDSLSETVCIPCLIRSYVVDRLFYLRSTMINLFKHVIPLFFLLVKGKTPIGRAWKIARKIKVGR